eukprot:6322792-Pyramimonas_sp.AAC.1
MPHMPQFGMVAADGMGGMMGPTLNFTSESSLEIDDAMPSSAPPTGPYQPDPAQQPMPHMEGHGPMPGHPVPQ